MNYKGEANETKKAVQGLRPRTAFIISLAGVADIDLLQRSDAGVARVDCHRNYTSPLAAEKLDLHDLPAFPACP